jgi:tetratricopeptide (TPR) repeat protein
MWLAQMPSLLNAARREALQRKIIGATRERMLREIIAAIEALTADTPLVLVIEDLHWSDYSTLDFVSAVAQRREPARLLVIGTWRPIEVNLSGHPIKGVNQELQTRRCCVELSLELLTEAAVGEYLTARFPKHYVPDGLTALIYRRSEGNPLFMVNLADYLLARGVIADESRQDAVPLNETEIVAPESILPMIERQIDRLNDDERRVLETASVAGVEFSASVVAAADDADVAQIEELCKGLERRNHFLSAAGRDRRPDGMGAADYRFIHALYQNVFYERMSRARRRLLHQQIAERKESAYGSRAVEIAAELAMHFEEGGDWRRAIKYLREAAEKALCSYANREAISYLRRALKLIERSPAAERPGPQIKILERLGTVYCSMDEMAEAAKAYEAVVACAQIEEQVESEVGALIRLCKPLYWTDRQRCLEVVDRIGELSPRLQDELLKAHARGYCGIWNLHLRGWQDEDFMAMVAAVEAARKADDRALLGLHLTELSYHQCMRAEYRAACMATTEGLRLTLEIGDAYHYMTGQYFRSLALLHLGEWGELLRAINEGLVMADKNGHHLTNLCLQIQLAWLHEQAFDFERARELCEPIYQQSHTGLYGFFWCALLLGMAHLGLGSREHASGCFNQIINQLESTRFIMDRIFFLALHHGLSRYWFEQGEISRARHEAEQLWRMAAQSGERTYLALGRQTLAEIALAEQDYAKAEAELSYAINAITDGDTPLAEWRVWLTASRLRVASGRRAEAAHDRARSLAILNRLADSLGQDEPLRQKLLAHSSAQELQLIRSSDRHV